MKKNHLKNSWVREKKSSTADIHLLPPDRHDGVALAFAERRHTAPHSRGQQASGAEKSIRGGADFGLISNSFPDVNKQKSHGRVKLISTDYASV